MRDEMNLFENDFETSMEMPVTTENYQEPEEWTIIAALDRVLEEAYHSELKPELWKKIASPLAYLKEQLQMSDMQVVFLAMLIDAGKSLSWKAIANFFHCSRLKAMTYTEEMDGLFEKRWVTKRIEHEFGNQYQGYLLENGVTAALRHNKPFVPEKIDGLSEQRFVERLTSRISRGMSRHDIDFETEEQWMMNLVEANLHLPLCRFIHEMPTDVHNKTLLLLIVADYAEYGEGENEGLCLQTIDGLYPEEYECDFMRESLKDATHPLIERGYVEHKCEEGIVNNLQYMLTTKAKEKFLSEYSMHQHTPSNMGTQMLKSHSNIREKVLFFNSAEAKQLNRLASLLQQDQFSVIQQRLEESGMRRGFACLFYGAPGTGKTESVLQMARQTGRDIMQVDIASMRDKWVGESEKNIKQVFTRYREACKRTDVVPILFFNEADALINKRSETTATAVDKMENTMQNILLQEMEDFDGILIATTNLASNLDSAFERRFLFKIEFHKPVTEVKSKIWASMIHSLSSEEASVLASRYDFSGGQIENIARKNTIDYILTGNAPTLSQLDSYCKEELLMNKNTAKPIAGFRA